MTHVNPLMPLGGALSGTLPNPSLVTDEANLRLATMVFGSRSLDMARLLASDDLRSGVFGPKPLGVSGLATGDLAGTYPAPTVKSENLVDGLRAFLPHPPRIQEVQAGTNITIVQNARGPVISSSGGGSAGDSDQVVLPVTNFSRHAPAQTNVRAGTNATVTQDALGAVVSGNAPELDQLILSARAFSGSPPITVFSPIEQSIDVIRAFIPRDQRIPEVQAGSNITIVQNARGPVISASASGGAANTGTDTIDFGAFPGAAYASKAITGIAAILAGSLVKAYIYPAASADHSADEHLVDPPRIIASAPTAGVGFTIHAFTTTTLLHHGVWNVFWEWV